MSDRAFLPGSTLSGAGAEPTLLQALSTAAVSIQRSAQTEAQVLEAFKVQIAHLDLHGFISLVDESSARLLECTLACLSPGEERFDSLGGQNTAGRSLHLTKADAFGRVFETRRSLFVADTLPVISPFVPQSQPDLLERISQACQGCPAILASFVLESGQVGILTLAGRLLKAADAPAVEVFASHLAVALDHAGQSAALRQVETRYHSLVDSTIMGILIIDLDSLTILSANRIFEQISGYSEAELLSMKLTALHSPETLPEVLGNLESLRHQRQKMFEVSLCCKCGEERLLLLSATEFIENNRRLVQGLVYDITEQRGLETALRRRADELAALNRVTLNITAAQDLPTLLHTIIEQAVRLINGSAGSFYLCDEEHRQARCAVSFNNQKDYTGASLQYGEGITGEVAQTGQPMMVENYRDYPHRSALFKDESSVRAALSVPVIWNGQVTGVITVVQFGESRRFTQAELELITLFASQAAIAVENARLLQAERQRRQEAETLRQATSALTSTLDLDKVLDSILISLEQVVPYDSASVMLQEGDSLRAVAGRGFPDSKRVVGRYFPADNPLFVQVRLTGRSLILKNAQTDPSFENWGGTDYVLGWMGIPLFARGKVIGYLTCDSCQLAAYQYADARLAEAFANQAAIAIENAQLFEAERAQLLLSKTLQEMGSLLTTQISLHEVLENILNFLGRVVKYDSGSIQLLGQDGRLFLAAGRGFPDDINTGQIVRQLSDHMMLTQWRHTKVCVIPDTGTYPGWLAYPGTEYIRSWVGAPLLVKGRFIGSLNIDSRTVNAYDAATGETVMAFANQAAIAIENARLFEAEHIARERAEALREAVQVIGSTLSLDQVLKGVLDQLARVLSYDSGNVLLVEEDRLIIKVWRGFEAFVDSQMVEGVSFDLNSDQVAAVVVRSGEPLVVDDVQHDPRWQDMEVGRHIRSWLGVPLQVRDHVIGLFSLDRASSGGFSSEEVQLAQAFAMHAAAAIENANLFEAEGKRAAELQAIHQASLSLTASLKLPQVLDTILKSTLNLLPEVGNSHIFLYESESERLFFGAALWADRPYKEVPWSTPRPNGLTYSVARSGETILVNDMSSHPLYAEIKPPWTGAIIGMPLKIGPRVVGVMNVSYRRPRQFPEAELRALRLLGDQAAIAIENARLYEQVATERRHLALLYDISRDLVASLDPDEILNQAITLTTQALGGLYGEAFLFSPEENRLSLRALYGRKEYWLPVLEEILSTSPRMTLSFWMVQNRQAANIPDVTQDPRWFQVPGMDEDIRSTLTMPIMQGEQLLGMLSVLHQQKGAFSIEHVNLMQAICQEVGLALSNASRYQQVQRRLAEITLIHNLAQTLSQRLEIQVLLDEVVMQLGQRLGYPQVEIFLCEGESLVLRAFYGIPPEGNGLRLQEGILGRVACTGQTVLIPDVSQDPEYVPSIGNIYSQLAVPILRGTDVIGIINIQTKHAGRLSDQDRDVLQVLAGQISIALDNAELFERVISHAESLEQEVAQRTAELTELFKLSQEIGYQLSYEELLGLLLRRLRSAVWGEAGIGSLMTSDCLSLAIETSRPISPEALDEIRSRWLEILQQNHLQQNHLQQNHLQQNQGKANDLHQIQIEMIPADDFEEARPAILKINSLIQAPILVEQKFAGLLMVVSEKMDAFGEEQIRLLSTFANQAATAIQRLQTVLAAQQRNLESLIENIPVGTLLLDADFHLLVSNPLGREILTLLNGAPAESALTHLGSYTLQDLLEHQKNPLPMEITLEGPPHRVFTAQIRPVGESSTGAALKEKRQWVLTMREVTQEYENQARIQGQERLATVGQLAAGIAHDFNNIMAAILVYADLLHNDTRLPDASREKLSIIQKQVQRAASLIRQILDFSRRAVMDQSSLDLLPFIKELDRLLDRVLPETIRLELTYQPGTYMVKADPTRLQQVFMNLAVNARDAMPQGGVLHFDLGRQRLKPGEPPPFPNMPPGNWIRITVTDSGMGIPAETRNRIFEPFFTTKPVGQGTGLGLAQVYGIVKQHEGYILVESEVGKGTSFIIYLPALVISTGHQDPCDLPVLLDGRGETALVVEDDRATREALQALLEAQNYQVLSATNGLEALHHYEQSEKSIALVVSDVVMPEMGGVQLYRALMDRWPETKILFVTGHPLQGESQTLLEKGNVHWLQKPFSVQDFSQAVCKLLDGKK